MKDIKKYILEKQDWWTGEKYISKQDLLKFCVKALKQAKTTPDKIQDELSQYEDPDDLDAAYEREELDNLIAFEDALTDLLFNDNKYGGKEGDICDKVYLHIWDLMDELRDIYKL